MKKELIREKVSRISALVIAFGFVTLVAAPRPSSALEYHGWVDTRYQLQFGDNAADNDIFQYHYLELSFLKNMTFLWNGGLRKDLDGKTNEVTTDGKEKTDISFRGLPDAVNADQTFEYRIYTAYLKYSRERFGGLAGRYNPYEYEFTQFDGIMLWATPLERLRVEGFGGKPWHYGYVSDLEYYWGEGEVVLGAGADLSLLQEDEFRISLRYLYLKEKTQSTALIGETPETYLSSDHLTKMKLIYTLSPLLDTGVVGSFLGVDPRNIQAWASGNYERLLLAYSVEYSMQFIDISDISDRLTQYSAFLTASHPYFSVSADVSKNFSDIFNLKGFLSDVELELSYEHRQPLNEEDQSMFNQQYDQFRVGTIFATKSEWALQLYYTFILTSGLQNDINWVGGEIAKKWEKLNAQLGSSYYANKYETNYTQTVIQDSFYAQEYYFKLKWLLSRSFDLSFKVSYEHVNLTSLTSTEVINDEVQYAPMTELFSEPRDYFQFDVRTGFRF
jgi:hypothetical protein